MPVTNKTKYLIGIGGSAALGIVLLSRSVQPDMPDFTRYEAGAERKQVFFSYFLPLIEQHNTAVLESRQQVMVWNRDRDNIDWWDLFQIENLAEEYRLDDFDIDNDEHWTTLLRRVDAVPPSLALAQAANESGWGTSRFGREGYNFYGQWCYQPGCGMVPNGRNTGKMHEVAILIHPMNLLEVTSTTSIATMPTGHCVKFAPA